MRSLLVSMLVCGAASAQPSMVVPTSPQVPPPKIDHQPRTTVGVSFAMLSDILIAAGFDVRFAHRLRDRYYVDIGALAAGAYDPDFMGLGGLLGLRGGVSYVDCGPIGCRGLGITGGVETATWGGEELFHDPPEWSASRQSFVVEARGVLRARLGTSVALELAGGARANTKIAGAHDRLGFGFVLSLGLVGTM